MLKNLYSDFITAFQFLTRIQVKNPPAWAPGAFGRSVKFFPLIGGIIGLILAAIAYGAHFYAPGNAPVHVLAAVLIIVEIMITGALHCDGLMDTADGIFSGRSRERMLEIMKDSRIGAFGAISFFLLVLLKYSLLVDLPSGRLIPALFVMPVTARMTVVAAIALFPYARAEGLGKSFAGGTGSHTVWIAGLLTLVLVAPFGLTALWPAVAGFAFGLLAARYVANRLGGMTGDVYGAVLELSEVAVLVAFCL